ncbi:putative nuclease HARBI1 [Dermacentor albipictus]|uniref:putative nuclease HARBI1 n=1 Tax=Dermacentor albipictus TaxID=60249 RepID=UPI0038FCDAA5
MVAAVAAWVIASSGSKRQYDRLDRFTYMTDVEFQRHFRLSKTSVRWLRDELGEDSRLRRQRGGLHSLTVEEQVLCALRFYGTGSFQGSVGAERYIGRHQTTVSRCVGDVSDALIDAAVRKGWLDFPKTAAERAYYERGNITNVAGCVDGTYVGIKAPSRSNPDVVNADYFTRKAHYALNTMVAKALEDREFGAETRVSGLGVRLILGPCGAGVCGAFQEDGAASAASTTGA